MTNLTPRKCLWHKCGKTFTPHTRNAHFCSAECRNKRAMWKQSRGSPLVDLLIAGEWTKLKQHREQLKEETNQ